MAKNNNEKTYLTPHFTLEEMTVTNKKLGYLDRPRQTPPDAQVIENLTRVCQWLEMMRKEYNERYGGLSAFTPLSFRSARRLRRFACKEWVGGEAPVIVTSGYRCKELNRLVGGCPTSNHLTGCAADIHVTGKEQLLRYVVILLDLSDTHHQDFDELIMERDSKGYWLHFAVRPKNNRRNIHLLNVI